MGEVGAGERGGAPGAGTGGGAAVLCPFGGAGAGVPGPGGRRFGQAPEGVHGQRALQPVPGGGGEEGGVAGVGACGGIFAAVQPPSEPHGERLATGEGVFDAPEALRERGGAEGGGGRGP